MTTFVMPSEVFPVTMRATGHGISAGIGKLGAFIGVFLFPLLQSSLGLRGTLLLTAGISVLGLMLTRVLPETAGRSLDEVSGGEPLARRAGRRLRFGGWVPVRGDAGQRPVGAQARSAARPCSLKARSRRVRGYRLRGYRLPWLQVRGYRSRGCRRCGDGQRRREPSSGWPSRAQMRFSSYW